MSDVEALWREIRKLKERLAELETNDRRGLATLGHNHTSAAGEGGVLTNDEHDGYSEYAEIATPGDPAAGYGRFYFVDDDGTLKAAYKRPDGTEVLLEESSAGVTDHGALSGLGDDDHSQYYNDARHTLAAHETLGLGAPEIWLWPQLAIWTAGTSSEGQIGPGISKSYYRQFASGVHSALSWTFVVPAALAGVGVSVTAYYELQSATGNIRLERVHNIRVAGDGMGLGTEVSEAATKAAGSGLQIYTFPTPITFASAGTVYRLALRRRGADSADNNTGNLALFGLLLKKA